MSSRPAVETPGGQIPSRAWDSPQAARRYERGRPGYAPDAIRFLLRELRIRPDSQLLDLAAGTGKLTRQLQSSGARLIAVEPLAAMRSEFARRLPHVPVLVGTAESIPLETGSIDAVFVGQAWHWFDQQGAESEVRRVLRPGGGLALLWNEYDVRIPWVAEFRAFRFRSSVASPAPQLSTGPTIIVDSGHWSEVRSGSFGHLVRTPRSVLLDRMLSSSSIASLKASARTRIRKDLNHFLDEVPETREVPVIDVPYVTEVFLVQLRTT